MIKINIDDVGNSLILKKCTILNKSHSVMTHNLLYGKESFKDKLNLLILIATVDFALSTIRFDEPHYLL